MSKIKAPTKYVEEKGIEKIIQKLVANELGKTTAKKFKWTFQPEHNIYIGPGYCPAENDWYIILNYWGLTTAELMRTIKFCEKYNYEFQTPTLVDLKLKLPHNVIMKLKPEGEWNKKLISDIIIEVAYDKLSLDEVPKTDFFEQDERIAGLHAVIEFNVI